MNLSNQALGECLSSFIDFLSKQTLSLSFYCDKSRITQALLFAAALLSDKHLRQEVLLAVSFYFFFFYNCIRSQNLVIVLCFISDLEFYFPILARLLYMVTLFFLSSKYIVYTHFIWLWVLEFKSNFFSLKLMQDMLPSWNFQCQSCFLWSIGKCWTWCGNQRHI